MGQLFCPAGGGIVLAVSGWAETVRSLLPSPSIIHRPMVCDIGAGHVMARFVDDAALSKAQPTIAGGLSFHHA